MFSPGDLVESLGLVLGPAPSPRAEPDRVALDPPDDKLMDLILTGMGDVDDLLAEIGIATGEGLARLGSLELQGLIRSDGAGRYVPS